MAIKADFINEFCFEDKITQMSPFRIIIKNIGELLIERNIINEEQLMITLQEQRKKGGCLSQHLIALKFVNEVDIVHCFTSKYGFPQMSLNKYLIPPELLGVIPLELITTYSVLPIYKKGGILTVAMADTLNDGLLDMLKVITGCDIDINISAYHELRMAIDRNFGQRSIQISQDAMIDEELLKEDADKSFIKAVGYSGPERRAYKRFNLELDMNLVFQDKTFQVRTKDVSYSGLSFACDLPIPPDTDVLSKLYLRDNFIYAVVHIVRIERIIETKQINSKEIKFLNYAIAGFFEFMTEESRNKIATFLKEQIY